MLGAAAKARGSDRFVNVLFQDVTKTDAQQVAAHRQAYAASKARPGEYPVGLIIKMTHLEATTMQSWRS